MSERGFGVAAGLEPEVAKPLAAKCAELGYSSIWSNDHPGAKGLETLAAFAEGSDSLDLGVAVIALDRQGPEEIAADIERLGLPKERLWIGVGAGFTEKPLTKMRESLSQLREALPDVRLVLAAMGPKMCALGGATYDGVFFNWMTPGLHHRRQDQRRVRRQGGAPRSCPARVRLRAHRGRRRRRSSASPRRSPSTATSTTATATTSPASAPSRGRLGSPPRTPTPRRRPSPNTTRSTRSSSAAWPRPRSRRWARSPKLPHPQNASS